MKEQEKKNKMIEEGRKKMRGSEPQVTISPKPEPAAGLN